VTVIPPCPVSAQPRPMAASAPFVLRSAPPIDAPYDDEREHLPPPVDGTLALAFPPPVRVGVPLRLVPPAGGAAPIAPSDRRNRLPDPRPWTARLAQAIVEVLAGARSPVQLADVASLDVLRLLERSAGRLGGSGGPQRRPVVRSVRVSEPCDGVAEGCAVVDTGTRRRALALRLEEVRGRWRCTAVQVG
jgi:hypothetical protein